LNNHSKEEKKKIIIKNKYKDNMGNKFEEISFQNKFKPPRTTASLKSNFKKRKRFIFVKTSERSKKV